MAEPKQTADTLFLAGEVHALLSFALALATVHPNREALRQHFAISSQAGLAKIESQPISDRAIRGFQFAADRIQKALEGPSETHSVHDSE